MKGQSQGCRTSRVATKMLTASTLPTPSNPTNHTQTLNEHPSAWSPDGRKILFSLKRLSLGYSNILVMNANGTDQSLLFDASMLYEDIGRHGEPADVKSPADLSLLSTLTGMRRIHRITRR